MILNTIIAVFAITLVLSYVYIRRRYQYWAKRGIFCPTPSFPMGNVQGIGVSRHTSEICKAVYDAGKRKGPFCGMYFFISPTVVIRSPELAKNILIRDFECFHDRGFYCNERDDPLSAHLFSLEGTKWKNIRSKLSPSFTSGKMRMMFGTVHETANQMLEYLKLNTTINECIDIKDLMSRYTTDVIGGCAFGLSFSSIFNPDDPFRRNGQRFFEPSKKQQYSIFFGNAFPQLARMLKVCIFPADATQYFIDVVREMIKFRKQNDIVRKDFMQLLIELQHKGTIENDIFTDLELAAEAFVFFIAGSETSASTMTFTLYELAVNPIIQTRVRDEINAVLEKFNDEVTYDSLTEMKYLNRVISESLRKYPPAENLFRKPNRDYSVPDTNQVIEKGTLCLIPVYAFHRDENNFPDPDKFDPDRFTDENKAKRHPFSFIPFGYGPRFCIGERFGLMQIQMGIANIVKNFEIIPSEDTPTRITLCKKAAFLSPDRPIVLKFRKINY